VRKELNGYLDQLDARRFVAGAGGAGDEPESVM
jgi:hypothetical protein